jgi:hypothetical protein
MQPFEARLIHRKLDRDLFIAIGLLVLTLARAWEIVNEKKE